MHLGSGYYTLMLTQDHDLLYKMSNYDTCSFKLKHIASLECESNLFREMTVVW